MIKQWTVFNLFCSLMFLLLQGCSSSSSSSSSSDTNGLSDTFPNDFAIASPFSSSSNSDSSRLVVKELSKSKVQSATATDLENFSDKVERIDSLINADSIDECTFNFNLFGGGITSPECYGPTLSYTDHPDASGGPDDGQLPSGDLGIWSENEGDQACLAAKMNELISKVEERIDFSVNIFAWLLCVAGVQGKDTLPAVNGSTDLTTEVNNATSETGIGFDFSSATITRLDNDANGNAQYESSLSVTVTDSEKSLDMSLNMRHVPIDEDQYKGRIWTTMSGVFDIGGNCNAPANAQSLIATSIGYERDSDTELKANFESAGFCDPDDADPFTTSKRIDPQNAFDQSSNPGGWANNLNQGIIQTTDSETSIVYRWMAGQNDSHARTFIVNIEPNSDGVQAGCGYFGFTPPTTATSAIIDNLVMICNWAGPSGNHNTNVTEVQRQCVTQNSTTGKFVSDSTRLNISYAPVNSCSYDGSGTTTFGGSGDAISKDLFNRSNITDFSLPTEPTSVF